MTTRTIKFEAGIVPVLKFNQNHDSKTGEFSTGIGSGTSESGSPKLTIVGKNDGTNDFFNQSTRVVRFQPEGGEPTDYVLFSGDKNLVVAIKKPTDGTTINGMSYKSDEQKGEQKGQVGYLDATDMQKNPWRKNSVDGKATVVEVVVKLAHQRRGLASAMLKFHRDMYPKLDIQHSDALLADGKAWASVIKFNPNHDEIGRFATAHGSGGNGLSQREIHLLMAYSGDRNMNALYDAEESIRPEVNGIIEKPTINSFSSFNSAEEYKNAYKDYSKKFTEWMRQETHNIQSGLGEKLLDGSAAGVRKYVESVVKADWFVKSFGDGGRVGVPQVALRDSAAAGSYKIGTKNGVGFSAMVINSGYSQSESTILHEITHYATAISATSFYEPHGAQFAKNRLYILSKVAGDASAKELHDAYVKGKVNVA